MPRYIDAEELNKVKFHPLPYTHITPPDADAQSYEMGWNDAVDAIIENAPTADVVERKRGRWILDDVGCHCSECFYGWEYMTGVPIESYDFNFCPNCGAEMKGEEDE